MKCTLRLLVSLPVVMLNAAEFPIALTASIESPAPVGTVVVWTADTSAASGQKLQYRFRARKAGGEFSMIRDFGPNPELAWSVSDKEGRYEVELTAREAAAQDESTAVKSFEFTALAGPSGPAVRQSWHPLVYQYAAPACPQGSLMKVYWRAGDGRTQESGAQSCDGETSMNFLVAGLKPETSYAVWHELSGPSGSSFGSRMSFATTDVVLPIAPVSVSGQASPDYGILLQSSLGQMTTAHDTDGNLAWYYAGEIAYLTRPAGNGRFLGIVQEPSLGKEYQAVRMFDLVGFTLKETNAARINEQLVAMGKREISGFHHEALEMPDGKLLVLAGSEQVLKDVQGAGDVNVIGDTILVLDRELRVYWVWDSFDHMDTRRLAIMGEKCTQGGGGCPPFYLTPTANDWLHSNSLQLSPDGNILMSVRHQDWVVKIDYQDGVAWGDVLWRLGKDGDFTTDSGDPWPWHSHQHDAGILHDGTLLIYDNGNDRRTADPLADSRGQRWQLDDSTMTARLVFNAGLGVYAAALGSAQALDGGTFHFNSGVALTGPGVVEAQSVETDADGKIVWKFSTRAAQYRTFRMKSLSLP